LGNPHPTKSKPIKIGRKHTQGKTQRQIQMAINGAKQMREDKRKFAKRHSERVTAYFQGKLEIYPCKKENINV